MASVVNCEDGIADLQKAIKTTISEIESVEGKKLRKLLTDSKNGYYIKMKRFKNLSDVFAIRSIICVNQFLVIYYFFTKVKWDYLVLPIISESSFLDYIY